MVVVAIRAGGGIAALAPDERHRGPVDRHQQHTGLGRYRPQVLIGAEAEPAGQLYAHGADARVLQRALEPWRIGALRQPEAAVQWAAKRLR